MTYLGTMVQAEKLKDEWIIIPYRQVGKIEDSELRGLYYNRFRYYDPSTGNYISQDPIGLAGKQDKKNKQNG